MRGSPLTAGAAMLPAQGLGVAQVSGLIGPRASDLEGQLVVILGFVPSADRYRVQTMSGEVIRLRGHNLIAPEPLLSAPHMAVHSVDAQQPGPTMEGELMTDKEQAWDDALRSTWLQGRGQLEQPSSSDQNYSGEVASCSHHSHLLSTTASTPVGRSQALRMPASSQLSPSARPPLPPPPPPWPASDEQLTPQALRSILSDMDRLGRELRERHPELAFANTAEPQAQVLPLPPLPPPPPQASTPVAFQAALAGMAEHPMAEQEVVSARDSQLRWLAAEEARVPPHHASRTATCSQPCQ